MGMAVRTWVAMVNRRGYRAEVTQAAWVEVAGSAGLWEAEVAARPAMGRAQRSRWLPSLQGPDEVELLAMFAGEDGGLLVVLHKFVHAMEPPLPNAVDAVHQLHLEVLVPP